MKEEPKGPAWGRRAALPEVRQAGARSRIDGKLPGQPEAGHSVPSAEQERKAAKTGTADAERLRRS